MLSAMHSLTATKNQGTVLSGTALFLKVSVAEFLTPAMFFSEYFLNGAVHEEVRSNPGSCC